jgi:hypothetical protein
MSEGPLYRGRAELRRRTGPMVVVGLYDKPYFETRRGAGVECKNLTCQSKPREGVVGGTDQSQPFSL